MEEGYENNDLEAEESLIPISGMYKDWFIDYASYVILERAVPAMRTVLNLYKEEFYIQ